MKANHFNRLSALLAASLAVVGCGDSGNYVVDESAENAPIVRGDETAETTQIPQTTQTAETTETTSTPQTTQTPEAAPISQPAPTPRTFDELVADGAKVDASGKSVDLSAVAALDGIDVAADASRWNAVKVVRGTGTLSAATLQSFAKLPNLTEFLWTNAAFPNADAEKAFGDFAANAPKTLKKVRLTGWKNADGTFPKSGFTALSRLPNLVDLDVSGSPATAADLEFAADGFPKLTKINLYQTNVGNAGVDKLLPLADRLVSLNLDDAKIDPTSADKIAQFARLTFLHVGRSELDDASILKFAKLEKLAKIHVTRSKATESGADALRAALPNCEVVSQPEN